MPIIINDNICEAWRWCDILYVPELHDFDNYPLAIFEYISCL